MLQSIAIVEAAKDQTKLPEPEGIYWREGLDRLVTAFNENASLNSFGEEHVKALLVDKLVNRLQIEDWLRRHPEIKDEKIDRPVFGLGLPRTASTALGVMLGQDPDRRVLRTWEARRPCPPPETATQFTDPRIAVSKAGLDALKASDPALAAMIPMSPDAATECLIITAMDFRSKEFEAFGRLSSYNDWLLHSDQVPAYRFHKQVLQLLQWRCPPNRWFLRTPAHSPFLPALDAVYPDASFVMTHRDVTKIMPSNMTFVLSLSQAFSDKQDLETMARHMVDFWEEALRRLVAFRDAGNEHRFFDIDFADFQSDPLREVRRFYDWLGEPLTEQAEQNMRAWWAVQNEERQSYGKIDFEALGISMDELRRRFAFYTDRYVR